MIHKVAPAGRGRGSEGNVAFIGQLHVGQSTAVVVKMNWLSWHVWCLLILVAHHNNREFHRLYSSARHWKRSSTAQSQLNKEGLTRRMDRRTNRTKLLGQTTFQSWYTKLTDFQRWIFTVVLVQQIFRLKMNCLAKIVRLLSSICCLKPWMACFTSVVPEKTFECGDITNTLVGISGETVPKGGNLCIYWPSNHTIWWVVVLNSQLVCHTTLLPW